MKLMTIEEMRKMREELGLSLPALSELSEVPLGTVRKVLNGTSKNPRYHTRLKIQQALLVASIPDITYELHDSRSPQADDSRSPQADDEPQPAPSVLEEEAAAYNVGSTAAAASTEYDSHGLIKKAPGEYTAEDYFNLPDDQRAELIDGNFYDMATPTTIHQAIAGLVHARILTFIEGKGGSCMPFMSPIGVQLDRDKKTIVEPDVVILCDLKKFRRRVIFGAPDFVLEVLSPSTRRKDLTLKLYKYSNAGVREYWIIDPYKSSLLVYDFANNDGMPELMPLSGKRSVGIYGGELVIDLDEIKSLLDRLNLLDEAIVQTMKKKTKTRRSRSHGSLRDFRTFFFVPVFLFKPGFYSCRFFITKPALLFLFLLLLLLLQL